jgi:hypothetical protein
MSGMGEDENLKEKSKRGLAMRDKILALVPELRDDVALAVISATIEQATSIVNEVEGHFKVASRQLDANAVVAIMIQGALAVVCEGHPDEDIRGRLWKAGREVGEFLTERWAKQVEDAMAKQEADRKAGAS